MLNKFLIRIANKKDIPVIIDFIKKLAKYEKLQDELVVTESVLSENLFQNKYAEVLLAEENTIPVGFALFFHNFSTFLGKPGIYLEDLFIEKEHRGKGYGKQLLACLSKLAIERKCGRLEWAVLDWNQPSIDFYMALGAIPQDDWTIYRISGQILINLAKKLEYL